jgi:hypothetical protein
MGIGGQSFGHVATETTGRSSNDDRFASFCHNWALSNCSFRLGRFLAGKTVFFLSIAARYYI